MACSIIEFLESSPQMLVLEASLQSESRDDMLYRAFRIFLSLVLSTNPVIRTLATSAAGRLLKDPKVKEGLKARGTLESVDLRVTFWRRR